jgi:hypothetical protein
MQDEAMRSQAIMLMQARYVLRDLHHKHPNCGYGKMAEACHSAALAAYREAAKETGNGCSCGTCGC